MRRKGKPAVARDLRISGVELVPASRAEGRSGLLGTVDDRLRLDAPAVLVACHACGSRRWRRLRPRRQLPNGVPWVCERCNPPGPPTDQVEFVEVADA